MIDDGIKLRIFLPISAVGFILSTHANKVLGTSSPLLLLVLLPAVVVMLSVLSCGTCTGGSGGSGGRGWA